MVGIIVTVVVLVSLKFYGNNLIDNARSMADIAKSLVVFASIDMFLRIILFLPLSYLLALIGWRLIHCVDDFVGGLKTLGYAFLICRCFIGAILLYGVYWDSIFANLDIIIFPFVIAVITPFMIFALKKAQDYALFNGTDVDNTYTKPEAKLNVTHIVLVVAITLALLNQSIGITLADIKSTITEIERSSMIGD